MSRSIVFALGCWLWFSAIANAQTLHQPESASGFNFKQSKTFTQFAVAAANPLATEAGYQILKAGGSVVDAAIAIQMVLGLVEPQSSGLGGGAFMLHVDTQHRLQAYDGRETAPALATENLFLGVDGKPMTFNGAVVGGRAVGTMGTLKMLELAYQQHGKLPWANLFQPAIDLATKGFPVSPRMNALLQTETALKKDPAALSYFFDSHGQPWPVGHMLKNPEYADVLQMIARDGVQAFYAGELAEAITHKVQSHATNPGALSMSDLASYQAKEREPFCTDYASNDPPLKASKAYVICGMPPPNSGAIAIAQILGILNHTQASTMKGPSPEWLHLYTEAARLALADRAQYVADPDFVAPPAGDWHSLVAPDYLASRAKLIGSQAMLDSAATFGIPAGSKTAYMPMPSQVEHGTSHISVIDASGNALAMTSSIEDAWGSRQMVNRGKLDASGQPMQGGFLLNNELTDFSFLPTGLDGKPIANRVEPGKRPRSAMSPTLVFDKATGQLVASLGSPGGELIIHFNAKTLYGMLNWGLDVQEAINLPNFAVFNGMVFLERARFTSTDIAAIKDRGHPVHEINLTSGIQGIQTTIKGFNGGADPRREGVVLGD